MSQSALIETLSCEGRMNTLPIHGRVLFWVLHEVIPYEEQLV